MNEAKDTAGDGQGKPGSNEQAQTATPGSQSETQDNRKPTNGGDQDGSPDGENKQSESKRGDGENKDDDKADGNKKEQKHSRLPLIIGAIVVLVAIIASIIYYLATRNEVSTDDAYTDGRAISIASNVSGYVTQLNVDDNSFVKTGDLLLMIDPRETAASVQQAQANLVLAQSQLDSSKVDLETARVRAPAQLEQAQAQLAQAVAQEVQAAQMYRMQHGTDQRATAATDVDQSTEQLRAAQASVKQARAQVATASLIPQMLATATEAVKQRQAQLLQAQANLAQAEVKLSYSEIRAPQAGRITMRNAELGTFVQTGQQVFYIVTPQVWITANFKENQLARMRPGQRVTIAVDAYPKLKLRGYVESIQEGSGARFSAFPAENATGNFVKIVRRVPVKIVIDHGLPPGMLGLPLGLSVEPTVNVK